jgi:hypothetical protein
VKPTPILYFPHNFMDMMREKLDQNSEQTSTGCILWTASLDTNGYGKFHIPRRIFGRRRLTGAHRASWLVHQGPIDDPELQVHHECFTPRCINPSHLELLTEEENVRRKNPNRRNPGPLPYDDLDKHQCKTHGKTDGYLKLRNDGYFFWACRHCARAAKERYRGK